MILNPGFWDKDPSYPLKDGFDTQNVFVDPLRLLTHSIRPKHVKKNNYRENREYNRVFIDKKNKSQYWIGVKEQRNYA